MDFDKTRLYTSFNADKVKVGSKGYFADSISELKRKINESEELLTLTKIYGEEAATRFAITPVSSYFLFYLVEEPKEKIYRPYKDTAEMPNGAMLNVVVASDGTRLLITAVEDKRIYLGPQGWVDMFDLYKYYTWPNGTSCGKEEEQGNDNDNDR